MIASTMPTAADLRVGQIVVVTDALGHRRGCQIESLYPDLNVIAGTFARVDGTVVTYRRTTIGLHGARKIAVLLDPPAPDAALSFDEVEAAGLDGTLR